MKRVHWLIALAVAAGALLRLVQLDVRPMHTDEAVHAFKFGDLLERGEYRYDKNEYHGPTLNYVSLIPAWLCSVRYFADVSAELLRMVPAIFGILLIALLFLFTGLGARATAGAAILTAVSPAMVFFSRYYIQEMLLVCFSFGLIVAGYRMLVTGRSAWAVAAGICAGLMYATKETSLIAFGAMGLASAGVVVARRLEHLPLPMVRRQSVVLAVLSACAVAVLFFSSFFTHWRGVPDSFLAYSTYFDRASNIGPHIHPWYYFVQLLGWSKSIDRPVWTEAGIIVFGLAGTVMAFAGDRNAPGNGRSLRMWVALYAVLMFVIASAIPYKTPWVILSALHGLILMAGVGVEGLLRRTKGLWHAGSLVVTVMVCHLAWQAYLASFRHYDDPANPCVYAQPTDDVKAIVKSVESVVFATTPDEPASVQVVYQGSDYWPLPWYFRSLPKTGWWFSVSDDFIPAPIILTSPELEPDVARILYEKRAPGSRPLYVPLFDKPMFLRPGMEIRGYVTLDLSTRVHGGRRN
jgi:uncharacterized protein (TIGR03663 family)